MTIVKADGDDLVHSDGKTAQKACELIRQYKDSTFFLAVGFLGSYTTFSSFTVESMNLMRDGGIGAGLINIFGNNLIGLLCAMAGSYLARWIR